MSWLRTTARSAQVRKALLHLLRRRRRTAIGVCPPSLTAKCSPCFRELLRLPWAGSPREVCPIAQTSIICLADSFSAFEAFATSVQSDIFKPTKYGGKYTVTLIPGMYFAVSLRGSTFYVY